MVAYNSHLVSFFSHRVLLPVAPVSAVPFVEERYQRHYLDPMALLNPCPTVVTTGSPVLKLAGQSLRVHRVYRVYCQDSVA